MTLTGTILRSLIDSHVINSLNDYRATRFGKKGWRFQWRADRMDAYVIEFENDDSMIMFMLKYGAK